MANATANECAISHNAAKSGTRTGYQIQALKARQPQGALLTTTGCWAFSFLFVSIRGVKYALR